MLRMTSRQLSRIRGDPNCAAPQMTRPWASANEESRGMDVPFVEKEMFDALTSFDVFRS